MDQIRKFFGWLKRQHFWVLAGIIAAIAVYCWYSAAAALHSEFTANESEIKGQFSAVQGVSSQAFIANEDINAKQTEEIAKHTAAVIEIWEQLYKRQSEGVLQWPIELSQRFRDEVAKLKFEDEIARNLREEYLNYIDDHFEALPNKIGARVLPPGQGGFAGGGGYSRGMEFSRGGEYGGEMAYSQSPDGLEEEEDDYLVEWLDQQRVREELNFGQTPSSLQIWVTQENLWVYHTLLDIIAATNQAAGADRKSNAAVRTVVALEVGKMAAQAASAAKGRIYQPPQAAAPMGEMGIPMTDPMAAGGEAGVTPEGGAYGGYGGEFGGRGGEFGGAYGMEGGMGQPGAEQDRTVLLANRYLNPDGQPIPVTSPTPTPGEFGKEYKLLPIRMTMEMDLRWLSHLIANCANQPLQVEVQEVRINPLNAGMSGGGYGGGFGGEFGGRGGGFSSGGANASPFASAPGRGGEILTFNSRPHIAMVIIQGNICIFNEPDPASLGAPQDAATVALVP